MEIAELVLLDALIRRARARIVRRMMTFGRMHPLTVQATLLSLRLNEKKENIVA